MVLKLEGVTHDKQESYDYFCKPLVTLDQNMYIGRFSNLKLLKIIDVSKKIQNLLLEETERTEVFNAIFSYFYAPFVYRSSFFIVQILFCMNIMPTFMTPFASIWPVVKKIFSLQ